MSDIITLPITNTTEFEAPGLGLFLNPASLLFNGVDQFVSIGDNYDYGPAVPFSFSLWIKPASLAAQRALLSKTTNDANVWGIGLYHNSSGKPFLQLRASGALRQHTFASSFTAATWQHFALTYNGGSNMNGITGYINAVADPAPSSASLGDWTNSDNFHFGKRNSSFFYSGNMNNISFWDKELSSAEVTEIYNSGVPSNLANHSAVANLDSWWYLNNGDDFPTETDQDGSIDGTLNNYSDAGSAYDTGDVPS